MRFSGLPGTQEEGLCARHNGLSRLSPSCSAQLARFGGKTAAGADEDERSMACHGFVRVATAVPTVRVGDCAFNAGRILGLLWRAEELGAAVVLFPELSLTGYTCEEVLGRNCRFEPSCSAYFIGAVKKYGAIRGVWRGIWRICRCNPWNPGGFDPP